MGYSEDVMRSLTIALRDSDSLRMALREFNSNIDVFERLTEAIEKQNELKEMELQLLLNKSTTKGPALTFQPIVPKK